MRRFVRLEALFVPVIAVVLFGFAPNPSPGTIRTVDAETHILTMEDGTTYALRPDFSLGDLRSGDRVLVTWGMFHGKLAVDHIAPCTDQPACQNRETAGVSGQ